MPGRAVFAVLILFSLHTISLQAQVQDSALLTLDRLFLSDEFSPQWFGPAKWIDHGSAYTMAERSGRSPGGRDIVRYETATGQRSMLVSSNQLVPPGATLPLAIDGYQWSRDRKHVLIYTQSRKVWRQNTRGDYWVLEMKNRKMTKLGGDARPSTLMFAKFSPDGRRVGYVRENNIYVEDVEGGKIIGLTTNGSPTLINGTSDWVNDEEFDIRDGFRWSPDGKWIAYWQFNTENVRTFYLINNTDSLYPFLIPIRYPNPGETNSLCRIGVVSTEGGETRWMDVPGDPGNTYIPRMEWAENSDEVVLQHMNRLQNTNELLIADARTGRTRAVLTEHDSTWVEAVNDFRWLDGGKAFLWVSERDGWRHVYCCSESGEELRLLTPGNHDVIDVAAVDKNGGWLYYSASPDNPTQRYLYRVNLNGASRPERVGKASPPGTHSYVISPDGMWAFHTYSSFEEPPVTELIRLPEHRTVRTLVDNAALRSRVRKLKRRPVEFLKVDIGGGVQLDAFCMKPADFDSTRRYPVLFHVYGEPASSTVHDQWGASDATWHTLLTQQGYIVMSVDNRGTDVPRGRAWRRAIYRQIGILASQDQAAAARVVRQWPFVDSTRIGIWGSSGGGSMSLNAIFRYPELYQTAIAVAAVPNQRYYDSIYQERYMGLPGENPDGYTYGSPITYADRLRGNLLIIHGTGDDNVHYKGAEELANALIAANKHFLMMGYPNRSHDINEGKNTRRHHYELMTWFLNSYLPPGPAGR
jgi:dipeptidyl-peptidase-4